MATDGEVAGAYPLVLRVRQEGQVTEHELVPLADGRLMLPEPISHPGVQFESIRPAAPEYGLLATGLHEQEPLSPHVGLLVEEPATVIVESEDRNQPLFAGLIHVSERGRLDDLRPPKLTATGRVTLRCPPGGKVLYAGDQESPPAIGFDEGQGIFLTHLSPGGEATFRMDAVEWEEVEIPLTDWTEKQAMTDRTVSFRYPWSPSKMEVDSSGRFRVRLQKNLPMREADFRLNVPIYAPAVDGWSPYGVFMLPEGKAILLADPPPLCNVIWPDGFQPLKRLRSAPIAPSLIATPWQNSPESAPTDSMRVWMQHELAGRWADEPSHRVVARISLLGSAPKAMDLAAVTTAHRRELHWSWESADAEERQRAARFSVESEWKKPGVAKVQLKTTWDSSSPDPVRLMHSPSVLQADSDSSQGWTHRAVWDRRSEVGRLWVGSAPLPAEPSSDPIELVVWAHRVQCQDERGRPVPFAPVRYLVGDFLSNFAMADAEGILQVHVFGSPGLVLDTTDPVFPAKLFLPGPLEAESPGHYPPRPENPILVYTDSKRWIDVEVVGLEHPHNVIATLLYTLGEETIQRVEQTMQLDSLGKARFRNIRPGSYEVRCTDHQEFSDTRTVFLEEGQDFATVEVVAPSSH